MNAEMEAVADRLRAEGRKVYTIPGGGSNPTGALGYVNCAFELVGQANDRGLVIDHLVHATGSAGTQAGLIVGLKAINARHPAAGHRRARAEGEAGGERLQAGRRRRPRSSAARASSRARTWWPTPTMSGQGYGIPRDDTIEAIRMFAELEGILLDPVYSGKGAAGLIDLMPQGQVQEGRARRLPAHRRRRRRCSAMTPAFDSADRSERLEAA